MDLLRDSTLHQYIILYCPLKWLYTGSKHYVMLQSYNPQCQSTSFSSVLVTNNFEIYPNNSYQNSCSKMNASNLKVCHTTEHTISNSPNSSYTVIRSPMICKVIISGFTLRHLSGNFTSFPAVKLSDPILTFPSSFKFSRRNFKSRAVPHWMISLRTEQRGFPSNCRLCRCGRKPRAWGNLDRENKILITKICIQL